MVFPNSWKRFKISALLVNAVPTVYFETSFPSRYGEIVGEVLLIGQRIVKL